MHVGTTTTSPASLAASAEQFLAAQFPLWSHLPRRIATGSDAVHPIRPRAAIPGASSATDLDRAAATRADLASALRPIRDRLLDARATSREPLDEIADALIDLASRHADALPALAFTARTHHPDDQAVARAVLAVAAAVSLGWSRTDVRDAALAALIADFGLAALAFNPSALPRELTDVELARVRAHPGLSALLASRIDALPHRVVLAISQHHERPDGRGTPRGLKRARIHDLALLVSACDTLAAIAAPRAHRPALAAHAAVEEVVRLGASGSLEASMAGAVARACGRFPPGSHVRLSTGDIAVVLARPPRHAPGRPVVRVMPFWGAGSFAAIGRPVTVDLAGGELSRVSVVCAVEPAAA